MMQNTAAKLVMTKDAPKGQKQSRNREFYNSLTVARSKWWGDADAVLEPTSFLRLFEHARHDVAHIKQIVVVFPEGFRSQTKVLQDKLRVQQPAVQLDGRVVPVWFHCRSVAVHRELFHSNTRHLAGPLMFAGPLASRGGAMLCIPRQRMGPVEYARITHASFHRRRGAAKPPAWNGLFARLTLERRLPTQPSGTQRVQRDAVNPDAPAAPLANPLARQRCVVDYHLDGEAVFIIKRSYFEDMMHYAWAPGMRLRMHWLNPTDRSQGWFECGTVAALRHPWGTEATPPDQPPRTRCSQPVVARELAERVVYPRSVWGAIEDIHVWASPWNCMRVQWDPENAPDKTTVRATCATITPAPSGAQPAVLGRAAAQAVASCEPPSDDDEVTAWVNPWEVQTLVPDHRKLPQTRWDKTTQLEDMLEDVTGLPIVATASAPGPLQPGPRPANPLHRTITTLRRSMLARAPGRAGEHLTSLPTQHAGAFSALPARAKPHTSALGPRLRVAARVVTRPTAYGELTTASGGGNAHLAPAQAAGVCGGRTGTAKKGAARQPGQQRGQQAAGVRDGPAGPPAPTTQVEARRARAPVVVPCCYVCHVWDDPEHLVACAGTCHRSYHVDCMADQGQDASVPGWKCLRCALDEPACAGCGHGELLGPPVQCGVPGCHRAWHIGCLHDVTRHLPARTGPGGELVICPAHYCAQCKGLIKARDVQPVKCWLCPRAYHVKCRPHDAVLVHGFPGVCQCPTCARVFRWERARQEAGSSDAPEYHVELMVWACRIAGLSPNLWDHITTQEQHDEWMAHLLCSKVARQAMHELLTTAAPAAPPTALGVAPAPAAQPPSAPAVPAHGAPRQERATAPTLAQQPVLQEASRAQQAHAHPPPPPPDVAKPPAKRARMLACDAAAPPAPSPPQPPPPPLSSASQPRLVSLPGAVPADTPTAATAPRGAVAGQLQPLMQARPPSSGAGLAPVSQPGLASTKTRDCTPAQHVMPADPLAIQRAVEGSGAEPPPPAHVPSAPAANSQPAPGKAVVGPAATPLAPHATSGPTAAVTAARQRLAQLLTSAVSHQFPPPTAASAPTSATTASTAPTSRAGTLPAHAVPPAYPTLASPSATGAACGAPAAPAHRVPSAPPTGNPGGDGGGPQCAPTATVDVKPVGRRVALPTAGARLPSLASSTVPGRGHIADALRTWAALMTTTPCVDKRQHGAQSPVATSPTALTASQASTGGPAPQLHPAHTSADPQAGTSTCAPPPVVAKRDTTAPHSAVSSAPAPSRTTQPAAETPTTQGGSATAITPATQPLVVATSAPYPGAPTGSGLQPGKAPVVHTTVPVPTASSRTVASVATTAAPMADMRDHTSMPTASSPVTQAAVSESPAPGASSLSGAEQPACQAAPPLLPQPGAVQASLTPPPVASSVAVAPSQPTRGSMGLESLAGTTSHAPPAPTHAAAPGLTAEPVTSGTDVAKGAAVPGTAAPVPQPAAPMPTPVSASPAAPASTPTPAAAAAAARNPVGVTMQPPPTWTSLTAVDLAAIARTAVTAAADAVPAVVSAPPAASSPPGAVAAVSVTVQPTPSPAAPSSSLPLAPLAAAGTRTLPPHAPGPDPTHAQTQDAATAQSQPVTVTVAAAGAMQVPKPSQTAAVAPSAGKHSAVQPAALPPATQSTPAQQPPARAVPSLPAAQQLAAPMPAPAAAPVVALSVSQPSATATPRTQTVPATPAAATTPSGSGAAAVSAAHPSHVPPAEPATESAAVEAVPEGMPCTAPGTVAQREPGVVAPSARDPPSAPMRATVVAQPAAIVSKERSDEPAPQPTSRPPSPAAAASTPIAAPACGTAVAHTAGGLNHQPGGTPASQLGASVTTRPPSPQASAPDKAETPAAGGAVSSGKAPVPAAQLEGSAPGSASKPVPAAQCSAQRAGAADDDARMPAASAPLRADTPAAPAAVVPMVRLASTTAGAHQPPGLPTASSQSQGAPPVDTQPGGVRPASHTPSTSAQQDTPGVQMDTAPHTTSPLVPPCADARSINEISRAALSAPTGSTSTPAAVQGVAQASVPTAPSEPPPPGAAAGQVRNPDQPKTSTSAHDPALESGPAVAATSGITSTKPKIAQRASQPELTNSKPVVAQPPQPPQPAKTGKGGGMQQPVGVGTPGGLQGAVAPSAPLAQVPGLTPAPPSGESTGSKRPVPPGGSAQPGAKRNDAAGASAETLACAVGQPGAEPQPSQVKPVADVRASDDPGPTGLLPAAAVGTEPPTQPPHRASAVHLEASKPPTAPVRLASGAGDIAGSAGAGKAPLGLANAPRCEATGLSSALPAVAKAVTDGVQAAGRQSAGGSTDGGARSNDRASGGQPGKRSASPSSVLVAADAAGKRPREGSSSGVGEAEAHGPGRQAQSGARAVAVPPVPSGAEPGEGINPGLGGDGGGQTDPAGRGPTSVRDTPCEPRATQALAVQRGPGAAQGVTPSVGTGGERASAGMPAPAAPAAPAARVSVPASDSDDDVVCVEERPAGCMYVPPRAGTGRTSKPPQAHRRSDSSGGGSRLNNKLSLDRQGQQNLKSMESIDLTFDSD